MRKLVVCLLLAAVAAGAASAQATHPSGIPASWTRVRLDAAGGTVWAGRIPNPFAPADRRASAIFLPPGYSTARRYPVLYLLPGMPGNAASIYDSLRIGRVADRLISAGRMPPFIAVMVTGGPTVDPQLGEWAGIWESFVVETVVPWVDAQLPTIPSAGGRALAGLCAGGFGAVDIGLRHPGMFGTLESWQGYFSPVFHDGPFVASGPADLAAHNPSLLVRQQAVSLRHAGVRFYVSVGGNHANVLRQWSLDFAGELNGLGIRHQLWLLPRRQRHHFWRATLPSALLYAGAGFRHEAPR